MMAQRRKTDVKVTLQKFVLAALAVVVIQVEPSSADCICLAIAYCSMVSMTDIIVSGSITKSCLTVYESRDLEEVIYDKTCERKKGLRSSTEEEQEYPDDGFFVSEYKLKIDHICQDAVNFTVPDTPRNIKFRSWGQGLESCRLDLDVDTEYVVGITMEQDGSLSSNVCTVTRAVDDLTEEQLAALENGDCSYTTEENP